VETLDKDIGSGFGPCPALTSIDPLALNQAEEALHECIVGMAAHSTHASESDCGPSGIAGVHH
jgi:hypothetical protein